MLCLPRCTQGCIFPLPQHHDVAPKGQAKSLPNKKLASNIQFSQLNYNYLGIKGVKNFFTVVVNVWSFGRIDITRDQ